MKPVYMGSGHGIKKPHKKITTSLCLQGDKKPWEWGWETLSMKAGWRLCLKDRGLQPLTAKTKFNCTQRSVFWHQLALYLILFENKDILPCTVEKPPHTSLSEPPKREQKQSKEACRCYGVSDLLTSYHDVTYKVHTKKLCDPGTNIKKFKKFIMF